MTTRPYDVSKPGQLVAWRSVLAVASLAACASDPPASGPTSEAHLEREQQALIGAAHANSAELNHTGVLLATLPSGETRHFCTGTLISPQTVVTAKHCVLEVPLMVSNDGPVLFATGPDAASPIEQIPVAWIETAPGDAGGFVQLGRDVAVVHLEYPSNVQPAKPQLLVGDWVGTSMMAIGYGVHNTEGSIDTQRRIGSSTITALEGRTFEALFGNFEAFLAPGDTVESLAEDPANLAFLGRLYEETLLYDQHEAVSGTASKDVQSCNGDSGGPLARFTITNGWETYGVVSGGLPSTRSQCDYGTVYSTFGPETLSFLEEQMAWVDPCGDVSTAGECSGNVARRCYTNFGANIRRIVEDDCAASGQDCLPSEAGVACGGETAARPESPEASQRVLEAIARASRPATVFDLVRPRP